jgi:nucleoside-diphosphate-sugar epimerase
MLATQGVTAPSRSVPLAVVRGAAVAMEAWAALRRSRAQPLLSRASLELVGHEMTVSDAKARRELGYRPAVSIDEGLAELRARHAAGTGGRAG